MGGAHEGARGMHLKNPGAADQASLPSKGGPFTILAGQVLRCQSAGAGGYGEPAQRDFERLALDLADGKVSEAAARKDYPAELVILALKRAREL
jgi:N-methylhydantoinase B